MKKIHWIFILILLSVVPLVDLVRPGLPLTHDGPDHVARIANFYQSLREGNVVPRWAGNLNWGYGHPILMFLYPLPSYITSFFHFIGFSFVDSTKLFFAISYIASLIAMFLWASAAFGSAPGFLAAIIYGFAPYRFVDLYVRGAIGEHVAFVFPPIILFGILKASHERFKSIQLWGSFIALGAFGLILSHNAISLIFFPIIFLYILYLYFFETKKSNRFFFYSLTFIALGFLLASFFWIPAFFEGKYTLRDIVTKGNFTDRFVPLGSFFISPWSYGGGSVFTKEIGFPGILAIFGSIVTFVISKKRNIRYLTGVLLLILLLSLFFMTSAFSFFWNTITLLQKFQFPWRLLSLVVFIVSTLGAIVVSLIKRPYQVLTVAGVILLIGISTFLMWRAQSYIIKNDAYYQGIYDSTTDTGESSPIWSVRFMEHRASAPLELIDGQAEVSQLRRTSTVHEYTVDAATRSRLVENTLYFPGWQVLVDGKPVSVEFQDPSYRGLMTFWVDEGEHVVKVAFRDTKLRKTANTVSLVGFGLLLLTVTIPLWIKRT